MCAVVTVLVSLGGFLTVAAGPAAAQEPRVRVMLDSITPFASKPADHVRITGRVVNTGDAPLSTVNAMFWFDRSPLTTRAELSAAAAEQPGERLGIRIDEPWNLVDQVTETLKPRASAKFAVDVPLSELEITRAGVYVVGVDIRGTLPNSSTRETWRARSFLPYLPKSTKMTPVEVAFVLPITERPSLIGGDEFAGGAGTAAQAGVPPTRDPGEPAPNLADFAPGGRLSRLIELGAAYDLTFAIDPELLAEAQQLSNGYTTAAGNKVGASATTDVLRWLNRARGVLAAGDAYVLPYADPDLPALERYRLTDRYPEAVKAAGQWAKDYQAAGTLVWPGTGFADAGTLETIASTGARTVLLTQNALPKLPRDGSSPVASLATPEGALTALVSDPTLTAGGPSGQSSAANVQQRFLSETALLAMAGGGSPKTLRRVVAAFPRTWDPGAGGATLFRTLESTSWLRRISTGALLSQAPTAYGGPLAPSNADRRAQLSPSVINRLRQLSSTTDSMLDLLARPEESRPSLDRGFLRGTSMAWRGHPEQAIDLIDAMDANLRSNISEVSVVPPRLVTLSSQSGRFPVTIWNRGNQAVRVQLQVRPRDPNVLTVAPIETVRVDPKRRATVSVTAETSSGGAVQMEVRLTTPSGTPFGPVQSFPVRVTGYGQVGWVVIYVGLGLLFLAAGARIVPRVRSALVARRSARRDQADEPDEPAPAEESTGGTAPDGTTEPESEPEPQPESEPEPQPATEPSVRFDETEDPQVVHNSQAAQIEHQDPAGVPDGRPAGATEAAGPSNESDPDLDMTKADR